MSKKLFILFSLLLLSIAACSKKSGELAASRTSGSPSTTETSQQPAEDYLATEHTISVDISEENIVSAYESTIAACLNDVENNGTILDSSISTGRYPAAFIRLRIKPEGVKAIISVASSKGEIIQQSTHSEDLAKPIVDNEKRLKMLGDHRDRLLKLEEKAADDIESLIKVSSELSRVQSELEQAMGENAYLLQRVSMDIVTIRFQVKQSRSFWKPVSDSLSDFSNNLSDSIAATISVVAYLLPGLVLILLVYFFMHFIRRKLKKKKS